MIRSEYVVMERGKAVALWLLGFTLGLVIGLVLGVLVMMVATKGA